jgi:hypothetical protein
LAAGAARSHDLLHAVLTASLAELDTEIAEKVTAIAVVQARLAVDPADRLVAEAEALGQPATSDDAVARARRRAAKARAANLADRARFDDLRIRLAVLLERRERLIDGTAARADAVSSFRDQCIEVYRAANLRRRRDEAATIAEAWHPPAFPPPAWLADVRTVPTGVPNTVPLGPVSGLVLAPVPGPKAAPSSGSSLPGGIPSGSTQSDGTSPEGRPSEPHLVTGKA